MWKLLAGIVAIAVTTAYVSAFQGAICQTDAQCESIDSDFRCVPASDNEKRCIGGCSCVKSQQCRVACTKPYSISCNCTGTPNTVQPTCQPNCQFLPSPCSNNTVCNDENGSSPAVCTCQPGYTGDPYSQEGCIDIDECISPYTCNCGTCTNTDGGYQCSCPADFGGPNCEIDLNCPPPAVPSPPYQTAQLQDGTVVTYRVGTESVTHAQAVDICCSEGARLIRILTDEKMILMLDIIFGDYAEFWTDGSNVNAVDKNDQTQWTTFCGQYIPFTPVLWWPSYNFDCPSCNCISIWGGYGANLNLECFRNYQYICEK